MKKKPRAVKQTAKTASETAAENQKALEEKELEIFNLRKELRKAREVVDSLTYQNAEHERTIRALQYENHRRCSWWSRIFH